MENANDQPSLAGLAQVKVAFDLSNGEGKTLLTYINVIDDARQSLIKLGVKPQIVIAFRGPATRLVQTDLTQVNPADREYIGKIAEKIDVLRSAEGVENIELCGVSMRFLGTNPRNVVPGVNVVENSWVSLAVYQAKGYGYVAP